VPQEVSVKRLEEGSSESFSILGIIAHGHGPFDRSRYRSPRRFKKVRRMVEWSRVTWGALSSVGQWVTVNPLQ